MTVVLEASVVVAALTESSPLGERCAQRIAGEHLVAPALLPFEVANVLRRLRLSGRLSTEATAVAYVALADELEAPLLTIDARLGRSAGARCEVLA